MSNALPWDRPLDVGQPEPPVNAADETEESIARSLTELTLANDLAELASREPLAPFAPWARDMACNLFARDVEENS